MAKPTRYLNYIVLYILQQTPYEKHNLLVPEKQVSIANAAKKHKTLEKIKKKHLFCFSGYLTADLHIQSFISSSQKFSPIRFVYLGLFHHTFQIRLWVWG